MTLTLEEKQDLSWWSYKRMSASHFIHTSHVMLTLCSDASLEGWGGTDGTSHVSPFQIGLILDNTTAAAFNDKMGGGGLLLVMALLWLSTAFVPGIGNTEADFHSRNFRDNTEWMLNPVVFQRLTEIYFVPAVDLFASRLNCKLTPLYSGNWNLGYGK